MLLRSLLLLVVALPLPAFDGAAVARLRGRSAPPIRVNSNLVLIGVSVSDPGNRPVVGLTREHFRILDNKNEQPLEYFSVDEAPLSLGIVFDTSSSMKRVAGDAREALLRLVEDASPADEGFLVTVSSRPQIAAAFTPEVGSLASRLTFANSKGCTALYDAMVMALHQMSSARHGRKALVVISDGYDNNSRYTAREMLRMVKESDVQIYTIRIRDSRWDDTTASTDMMETLAEAAGGRSFQMIEASELKSIAAEIGELLRNQYVLGFRPKSQARDGRYHRVEVKVLRPPGYPRLTPYGRLGYYSPAE